MSESERPEPSPERLKDFIAECILLFEREGEQALERRLAEEPQIADRARKRIAALRESGLLMEPRALPEFIGAYRVIRRIGDGGMGTVLLAEQQGDLHRRVAIKVIRPGLDSREVLARFALERQALATLEHQNIAKILDSGETEHGRPFMVMEFVAGVPITDYCDDRRLALADRIRLFCVVCDAVQHAHHKGIIHRDLKPSNVLVVDRDGRPWPMVIDFGVAKSVSGRLVDGTLVTMHGRILGTPEYMSPEQAANEVDIDTRADVFSLGVLLYELLTGTLPIDSTQLRQAGVGEILRVLQDSATPAPSRRITTLAGEATHAASRRLTDVVRLRRALRGDLDWITLRALERDRNRRYGMPGELAADLRRHLASQPVLAGPPGSVYRLRKFLARNLLGVAAAGAVFLSLVLGLWLSLSAYQRVAASVKQSDADFEQAIAAVERLMFFADERLAVEPHMDDVRRQMLLDALHFYERIAAGRTDTRSLELRVAKAHSRVGRIQNLLGDREASLSASNRARARFLELAARDETGGVGAALAGVELERARALAMLGRNQEAEAVLMAATDRHRVSMRAAGGALPTDHLRNHLLCLGALAKVLERHDAEAACAVLAEAEQLSRPWLHDEATPDKDRATALLLGVQHANALAGLGETAAARERVEPLLERFDSVFLGDPSERRQIFVEVGAELGLLLPRMGFSQEAEAVLKQAATQLRWYTAAHPAQVGPLRRLGLTLHALADVQLARNRLSEASSTQAECVTTFETLVEQAPEVRHQVLLGKVLLNYARILDAPRYFGGGVDPDVAAALERGIEILRGLPAAQRNERPTRLALAGALAHRGVDRERSGGDIRLAIEDLRQAVDEARQLVEADPELVDVRRLWVQHMVELMRVCAANGEAGRALVIAAEVEREAPGVEAAFPATIRKGAFARTAFRARLVAHAQLGDADELLRLVRQPSSVENDWVGYRRRIDALLLLLGAWPTHGQREAVIAEGRRLADQAIGFAAELGQTRAMVGLMQAQVEDLRVRIERSAGDLDAASDAAAGAVAGYAANLAARDDERNRGRVAAAVDTWLQLLWDLDDSRALLAGIDRSVQPFSEHADESWQLAEWCARLCHRCGEGDVEGKTLAQERGIAILRTWMSLPGTDSGLLSTAPTLAPLRSHVEFEKLLRDAGR